MRIASFIKGLDVTGTPRALAVLWYAAGVGRHLESRWYAAYEATCPRSVSFTARGLRDVCFHA